MGVKKDRSASCSVFRGKSDARGRDRAPQGGRSSRDNSFIRGSRNRNAWPEKKAAGGVFAPARADVNPPLVDVEGGGTGSRSRTVEGLDGDLSLVHVGVLDDAVAAGAALAAGGNVHEGDGTAAGEDAAELIDGGGPGDVADVEAVGGTLSHGARKTYTRFVRPATAPMCVTIRSGESAQKKVGWKTPKKKPIRVAQNARKSVGAIRLAGRGSASKTRGLRRRFVACVVQVDCTFRQTHQPSAQSVAHRLASSSASTGWYQSGLFTCVLSR